MSTHIECNDCGKVLDVEARFIELPFFCPDCEEKDVERSGYSEGPSDQQVTLDEESATIENTTLLIADLEQQVSASEKLVDTANELIADMSTQLKEDTEELGIRDRRIAFLEGELSDFAGRVTAFGNEMVNVAFDWDDERAYLLKSIDDIHTNKNATIDELNTTIAKQKLRIASAEYDAGEAEKKLASYGSRFRSLIEHRDRLRESLTDRHRIIVGLKQEVRYLYNRGLLARIRNA